MLNLDPDVYKKPAEGMPDRITLESLSDGENLVRDQGEVAVPFVIEDRLPPDANDYYDNTYDRKAFKYNYSFPFPFAGFNPDNGFMLEGSLCAMVGREQDDDKSAC